jgi:hypothetical protein
MDSIEVNEVEEGFKKVVDFYEVRWYINRRRLCDRYYKTFLKWKRKKKLTSVKRNDIIIFVAILRGNELFFEN